MNRLSILGLLVGVAWRFTWFATMPLNTPEASDRIRRDVLPGLLEGLLHRNPGSVDAVDWYIDFGSSATPTDATPSLDHWAVGGLEAWDSDMPVTLVAGKDEQPGVANRDDDQNGVIDDRSELGAAWSDDHCVTNSELQTAARATSRVVNRGAFLPDSMEAAVLSERRLRVTVVPSP